jgi:hypothetical protein
MSKKEDYKIRITDIFPAFGFTLYTSRNEWTLESNPDDDRRIIGRELLLVAYNLAWAGFGVYGIYEAVKGLASLIN